MAAARAAADPKSGAQAQVFDRQTKQLKDIRNAFNMAAVASDQFGVSTIKAVSASEALNEKIRKQKLGFWEAARSIGQLRKAYADQMRLQNASLSQFTSGMAGKTARDLLIPKNLSRELLDANSKYGYALETLRSINHQTVNWGKNTQWAGRQITVGLSMPLGVVAVAAAHAAYQVDKELTRIAKVYDTTSQDYVAAGQRQAAVDRELRQLRADSLQNSTRLAKQYGAAMTDTLQTEADLAATGLQGQELLRATSETTRIATLGEIDRQDALKMTIALQTAFKMNSEELTDTFNYMNTVENATSLGLQDIALATPRAASALAGLGVTAKQMTVMMAAMKESGVEAEQGANALKSAATRILNPTRGAIDEFAKHNIDIQAIVQKTQGNVYDYLTTLSAAMNEMTALERQQAIAKLFGTYQFNRLNALLANLGDAASGVSNQTKAAMDALGNSAEENANLADQEIRRFQESASGTFQRTFQGMKAELAQLGTPMLELVTVLVKGASGVLNFINSMNPLSKKLVLVAALAIGLVGPLMMLIGIIANLVGSAGKAVIAVFGLGTKFRILSAEQKGAQLAAQEATVAMNAQAAATSKLGIALSALQTRLGKVSQQQAALASANGLAFGQWAGPIPGQPGWNQPAKNTSLLGNTATAQKSWGSIAASAGQTAISVGAIAAGTALIAGKSEAASGHWFQIAMAAGLMAQMLPVGRIVSFLGAGSKAAGGMLSAIRGWMPAIMNFGKLALRFLGPIGVVAGGLLLIKQISDSLSDIQRKQEKINESAKDWSEILGYTYQEGKGPGQPEGPVKSIAQSVELSKKLREANEELAEALENAESRQEKLNLAIREGLKVASTGGSVDDAKTAVRTALSVAGFSDYEIEQDLMVKINAEVDFSNPESVAAQVANQLQKILDDAVNKIDTKDWLEKTFGNKGASDKALAEMSEAAKMFWAELSTYDGASPEGRQAADKMFDGFAQSLDKAAGPAFAAIKRNYGKELETLNVKSMEDLIAVMEAGPGVYEGNTEKLNAYNKAVNLNGLEIRKYRDINKKFIEELAKNAGISQDVYKEFYTLADLQDHMGLSLISVEEAQRNYNSEMARAAQSVYPLSDSQKLVALNAHRASAGLSKAKTLADGFSVSAKGAAGSAEELAEGMAAVAVSGQDLVNTLRDSMSGSMNDIYSEADRRWAEAVDARVNKIEREGEAKVKRIEARGEALDAEFDKKQEALDAKQKKEDKDFDKSWKARLKANEEYWDKRSANEEAAYDARIKQIEDQIKAEEEADKRREKLFQAERRRIERLANMYNRNVDFNAALASGNLDEAAKIANDASAQEQQWLIDDQSEGATDAAEQRKKSLEDKKNKINEEKKARLDLIKKLEEADKERLANIKEREQEALKARQDADKKALDSARQTAQKSIQAEREKAQQQIRINSDAERKKWEEKKRLLDLELATLKAFIPKNETELRAHVARVEAKYDEFGKDLKWKQSDWGQHLGKMLTQNVQRSATALRNDVKWRLVAEEITDEMAAAFDITGDQLLQWLKTGVFPATKSPGGGVKTGRSGIGNAMIRHSGGPTWSQKDRVGIPRSAGIYPSEVPTILKRGEYVVNEKATRKNLGLLESINAGRSPIAKEGRNVTGTLAMARHSGGIIGGIGGLVAAGVAKAITQGIAGLLGQTVDSMITQTMGGIDPNTLGAGAVDLILKGLRMQESSGNYKARSRISSASGAYQYIRGTWGNYGGYSEAWQAPPAVQDQRARADLLASYNRYKDWEKAIAHHFYPAWAGNKEKWGQAPGKGNPTVWDYVSGVLSKAGLGAGGGALGGGMFGRGGRWPAAQQGRVSPNTAGAVAHVRRNWPQVRSIGTLGNRPNKSDHPMGKAADFMIPSWNSPSGIALGNAIAQWFVNNPGAFGTKYVIWRDQINSGSGWRRYTHPNGPTNNPTLQHRDHVHLSVLHGGGMAGVSLPQLAVGGNIKYDNTVANLHKGETVLTAPLSKSLKDGIDNLDSGGKTVYDIDIDLRGAYIREDVDIERAVWAAIEKREKKNGRNRRVD